MGRIQGETLIRLGLIIEQMLRLNHISIAVRDIQKFGELYSRLFGLSFSSPKSVDTQKVKLSFAEIQGAKLELISPASGEGSIPTFLDKKGEGLHHICFEVGGLDEVLEDLMKKGVEVIGKPTMGSSGKRIVFLHPKSTGGVLIELKES